MGGNGFRSPPPATDNYVDSVDLAVANDNLTITLGRTGMLNNLTSTTPCPRNYRAAFRV